jgi:hypothetical protein
MLSILCTAFRSRSGDFPNLTIKQIPNTVLAKCEWGDDDYSLQIENLPMAKKPIKNRENCLTRKKKMRSANERKLTRMQKVEHSRNLWINGDVLKQSDNVPLIAK